MRTPIANQIVQQRESCAITELARAASLRSANQWSAQDEFFPSQGRCYRKCFMNGNKTAAWKER